MKYEKKRLRERLEKSKWQDIKIQTYSAWMCAIANGKMIDKFLIRNNYSKVAIYGLGALGRNLFEILTLSECKVVCVMDNTYSSSHDAYRGVPCLGLSDAVPEIDILIITAPEAEYEVKNLFKKVSYPVKSLQEVLFVL